MLIQYIFFEQLTQLLYLTNLSFELNNNNYMLLLIFNFFIIIFFFLYSTRDELVKKVFVFLTFILY